MTRAMLLINVVEAAERAADPRRGLSARRGPRPAPHPPAVLAGVLRQLPLTAVLLVVASAWSPWPRATGAAGWCSWGSR